MTAECYNGHCPFHCAKRDPDSGPFCDEYECRVRGTHIVSSTWYCGIDLPEREVDIVKAVETTYGMQRKRSTIHRMYLVRAVHSGDRKSVV